MQKNRLVGLAKSSVVFLTLPILLLAFSVGPDPRHTGAPGDQTCARSGCHTGTAVNGGGGRVELQLPGGLTYVPGQKQRIAVVITDGNATTRNYGFQATARLGSNEANGQAGTFSLVGRDVILCVDGRERTGASCPSTAALEFISHGDASNRTGRFEFDWTAPATDVGPVKIYVAGNAANGNGAATGDRIYTANVTLTPAASGGGDRPVITSNGGVVNGASFSPGIVAGSWTTIFGSNLASALKTWDGLIDAQGNFPTAIDGVRVTIDGLPAFINFVSANQINVQAPALTRTGMVPVVVTTPGGTSETVMANVVREAPGLFLFTQSPVRYPAVVRATDGRFIAPTGLFPGVTTEPAKPGDILLLFGTGFGPTTPAVVPGRVFSGAAPLADLSALQVRIGGMSVVPSFAGLSGSGLYQFNVTVPNLPDGNHRIEMLINGQQIQADVQLAVRR
ncbi:MAG: choice-of-anchor V domain-containing protein [Acidobacteriota bacterium]